PPGKDGGSQPYFNEYYAGDHDAQALPNAILPTDLSEEERRDAWRVLKGRMHRQETYCLDGSEREVHPHTVSDHRYCIQRVRSHPASEGRVFSAYEYESLAWQYERNPLDPRLTHHLTLSVDEFTHPTEEALVAYPRRFVEDRLDEQSRMLVTYTTRTYAQLV